MPGNKTEIQRVILPLGELGLNLVIVYLYLVL